MTSDEVGAAIDDGAATLAAVARATRACTSCGLCKERIRAMLGERGLLASRVAVAEAVPAGLV